MFMKTILMGRPWTILIRQALSSVERLPGHQEFVRSNRARTQASYRVIHDDKIDLVVAQELNRYLHSPFNEISNYKWSPNVYESADNGLHIKADFEKVVIETPINFNKEDLFGKSI